LLPAGQGNRVKLPITPLAGKAVGREDFSPFDHLFSSEDSAKACDYAVFFMFRTAWMRAVLFTRLPCLRQRRAAGASSVRYTATQQTADAAVDNL